MDLISYLEIMHNDSNNPCCLADIETDHILFMNVPMKKMLRVTEDYSDTKCYEIMQGNHERCSFCPNDQIEFGKFTENYIYNEKLQQYFRVNHTLLQYEGKSYNMCKYFLAPSFQQQQISFEDAIKGCEKIFQQEPGQRVDSFLELLGKYYNSERAYIYHIDQENQVIYSKHTWTKDGASPVNTAPADKMPMEKIMHWLESRNELGMVEANVLLKDFDSNSVEAELLRVFDLENIVLCDLGDRSALPEFMLGLSNRKELEFDYRLIHAVSLLFRTIDNVDEMKKTLEQVNDKDFLTGFYSKEHYARELEQLKHESPDNLGVLFVNINGLRKTNEFFGSAKGDEQIKETADLLFSHFHHLFCRISGDEFVGFFPNVQQADFDLAVNELRERMKQEDNHLFTMGHTWKKGNYEIEKLVVEADTMMYINQQKYYYSLAEENNPGNKKVLNDLLRYLKNDEFLVYLQPQVDLSTGNVVGAEALIRRFDKLKQRMVFPDQFIPLYEQESIIRHVDFFVIEEVCKMLAHWGEQKIPISVNLSRVTLLEHGIVDSIARICDLYHIDHKYVIIEVTERVGLIENDVASSLISQFMEQGFKISLDDFGCAYSNIVTLVKISVDEVKIDKSLVDELSFSEKNQIIVGNMLNMCNAFQSTHTLAEGIETQEQAEILRDYGCSYGQGYLFSRPIPHGEFFQRYIKR